MKKSAHALQIAYDTGKRTLMVRVLKTDRVTHHGFGTFLEGTKEGEVLMTQAAEAFLSRCPARRGLMGFECFDGGDAGLIVSYGARSPMICVPAEACSMNGATGALLKKVATIVPDNTLI